MLTYVLDAVSTVGVERAVIVVGHKAEWVTKKMQEHSHDVRIEFAEQAVQRGTGDATLVALAGLPDDEDDDDVLVLPGDAPLLRSATIEALVGQHRDSGAAATILSAVMNDPTGYGRVIRGKDGSVSMIVEQGDGTSDELAVDEVNTSIYVFRRSLLTPALRRVEPDNSQGEYYLTDVIGVLAGAGHRVDSLVVDDAAEVQGINDRVQLAAAESELRQRTNEALLRSGVTIVDPSAVYVDTTVAVGPDVTLFPGVILQGETIIGSGSEIGPDTHLIDSTVGCDCVLRTVAAERAEIGDRSRVGPFAALGHGSTVPSDTDTGPFYTADSN